MKTALIIIIAILAACLKVSGNCSREEERAVHCEECQHWDPAHCSEGQGWCPKVNGYRNSNWYCATGKNKIPR